VPVDVDVDAPRGRAWCRSPIRMRARMLPRLGTGAWWPDLDDLLEGIEQVVPDQVVASVDSSGSSARIA
jgi:hypothetical protein